ncbi:uncharacterized protein LOC129293963 isoform X2 [Prosopis cineraria]|uniref:uncharacterized protein LOC129293963 isoform X2 n=1 Tax=Prosopis cineraria TaxID=364024 RepID=UPI0024102373|nr:uncharacterized protein LOC129293963 isoform X2 [Prosopis cineraria]
MGKLGRILDTFCLSSSSSSSSSCFCVNSMEIKDDEIETKPLFASEISEGEQKLRLRDVVSGKQTLAFQLKPKIVILKVSMHCDGCAKKVEKHVSKLEGIDTGGEEEEEECLFMLSLLFCS